jgi:predicted MPP superfamily phosphohydrolase
MADSYPLFLCHTMEGTAVFCFFAKAQYFTIIDLYVGLNWGYFMEQKPRKMSRRKFLLKGAAAIFSGMGLSVGYSIFGERFWYETKHITLPLKRLPSAFSGMRMVQFSDIHLGKHFKMESFSDVIAKIKQLKPDLLCFTGDLFDANQGYPSEDVIPLLSQLEAPYGKWAVLGNHDYRSGVRKVADLLKRSGFTLLVNEHAVLENKNQRFHIVGVDEMLHGKPNLHMAMAEDHDQPFTLLLAHEPDFADRTSGFSIDLQISGHSHGGQVRLPFVGALSTPTYGEKYVEGLYKVKDSMLQVYTNRGIGTTLIPVRFMCRPEITVFTLHSI